MPKPYLKDGILQMILSLWSSPTAPYDLPQELNGLSMTPCHPQHKISSQALSFTFLNSSEEFNSSIQNI